MIDQKRRDELGDELEIKLMNDKVLPAVLPRGFTFKHIAKEEGGIDFWIIENDGVGFCRFPHHNYFIRRNRILFCCESDEWRSRLIRIRLIKFCAVQHRIINALDVAAHVQLNRFVAVAEKNFYAFIKTSGSIAKLSPLYDCHRDRNESGITQPGSHP